MARSTILPCTLPLLHAQQHASKVSVEVRRGMLGSPLNPWVAAVLQCLLAGMNKTSSFSCDKRASS